LFAIIWSVCLPICKAEAESIQKYDKQSSLFTVLVFVLKLSQYFIISYSLIIVNEIF